ncbi:peroxide stress protein YaaA [Hoyosella sp. YIM 151337]|uniref:peroxide stress protein YaaA n=1 Tax=Hoyosella sp. YIM 151337 TaxID=2992742 RepID=UPI00223563FA|nr:peroxide stress protein YaaA [Hoyosella sp. YIM 151337]MCW4353899.1 peroxide stress protein YaaA [Hoyosella sp. YIM 151337]
MLILLPPSETKATGGDGPPLRLDHLFLPSLTRVREMVLDALMSVSASPQAAAAALKLGPKQLGEAERNVVLRTAPTMPALDRYTGVLYDALDAGAMTLSQRGRADERIAIGSALFGVVGADDLIPCYRLSAGSKLPGLGSLRSMWRPLLSDALHGADSGLVVDLRSGGYSALGPVDGAITATVLTEQADGTRKVVSHFNKHHKGLLARALATTRAEPQNLTAVARVASRAGLKVEIASDRELLILTG